MELYDGPGSFFEMGHHPAPGAEPLRGGQDIRGRPLQPVLGDPRRRAKPAGRQRPRPGADIQPRPLQSPEETECTLSRFAASFPYPMQIMAPDGTLVLVNGAWQRMFKFSDAATAKMLGTYNILTHPLIEKWGMKEGVLRLFRGEPVQWKDVKVPLQEISDGLADGELVTETVYQNILSFPIYDDAAQMTHIAIIYITSRLYDGREDLEKGREYMENHWREKFDLPAVASAAGLSRSQFEKLFKARTGATPHQYYLQIKIAILQKKIKDSNLSIAQAFEECGMEYNSHYAGLFKKRTGMTPMAYRKSG